MFVVANANLLAEIINKCVVLCVGALHMFHAFMEISQYIKDIKLFKQLY